MPTSATSATTNMHHQSTAPAAALTAAAAVLAAWARAAAVACLLLYLLLMLSCLLLVLPRQLRPLSLVHLLPLTVGCWLQGHGPLHWQPAAKKQRQREHRQDIFRGCSDAKGSCT